MMTKIPPVQEITEVSYRTYTEFMFDKNYVERLKYRIKRKEKDSFEKDSELVKKVYASMGIGTNLDLAA